jgi:MSHA biogenesis protein MshK
MTLFVLVMAAYAAANVPGMKDPTRPLAAAASKVSAPGAERTHPTLESVLIGAGRRVAVINGRRMTEGEEHQGMKVWKIRPGEVVVSVDGSPRMTLEITNSRMHKELR